MTKAYKVRQFKNETCILMQRVNGGEGNTGEIVDLEGSGMQWGRFVSLFKLVCY